MNAASEIIGLIAGSEELPLVFADEAARDGKRVFAVAFRGYTAPEIDAKAETYWIDSIDISVVLDLLAEKGIKRIALEGKLPHSLVLSGENVNSDTMSLLRAARDLQTQTILKQVAGLLQGIGVDVMDARTYLGPVLCPKGILTRRPPSEAEMLDIEFGRSVLEKIGPADIGQLVVLKNRAVLAVEAIEGTDEAIKRGAELGGPGTVIVKMTKPGQDLRFDLPVIGQKTIRTMAACGAGVIAVESGKTVLLNRASVVELSDKSGISVAGI